MQWSMWSNILVSFILSNFVTLVCFFNFNLKLSLFEFFWSLFLKCPHEKCTRFDQTNFLGMLEYCLFSNVVLQYQYQGLSIILQYKTAAQGTNAAFSVTTFLIRDILMKQQAGRWWTHSGWGRQIWEKAWTVTGQWHCLQKFMDHWNFSLHGGF